MLPCMTSEPEQQIGVGTQDAFQRLWTPHRMAYIQGENKPSGPGAGDGCPFCSIPAKSDEDGLVVRRGEHVYAVLNLYPYTGGHLMTVPYRHVADYTDLTAPETTELAELTKQAMTALRTPSGARGVYSAPYGAATPPEDAAVIGLLQHRNADGTTGSPQP